MIFKHCKEERAVGEEIGIFGKNVRNERNLANEI